LKIKNYLKNDLATGRIIFFRVPKEMLIVRGGTKQLALGQV